MSAASLDELERRLGYAFRDRSLLEHARTHGSASASTLPSNERLELLGDAVLGLVVVEELYRRHPERGEGELTRMRAVVVSRATLAAAFERLGLEPFTRLGPLERRAAGTPISVRANLFESLLGAVYLDGGLAAAQGLVVRALGGVLEEVREVGSRRSAKSLLQERLQRGGGDPPSYACVGRSGPDHQPTFHCTANVRGTLLGEGRGPSKREAEEQAASDALARLEAAESCPSDEPDEPKRGARARPS